MMRAQREALTEERDMRNYEEGKYYGSFAEELGYRSARRVAEFGPFNTPSEAFEAAYAAMLEHPTATRLHIDRGVRHEVLDIVDLKYVAEWNFDRATLAVVSSLVDEDITDYPSELRAQAVRDEQDEERAVRFYADRAMRLGALEPWATSFARWAVRAGRTADLGTAYDEWRAARGWETRAEMDARSKFMSALSTEELVDWIRAGRPVPWHVLTA
jgi:hypothetical protein